MVILVSLAASSESVPDLVILLKAHSQHSAIRTTLPDGVINSLLNVKFFRLISFVLLGSGESVSELMKVKWHSPHLQLSCFLTLSYVFQAI